MPFTASPQTAIQSLTNTSNSCLLCLVHSQSTTSIMARYHLSPPCPIPIWLQSIHSSAKSMLCTIPATSNHHGSTQTCKPNLPSQTTTSYSLQICKQPIQITNPATKFHNPAKPLHRASITLTISSRASINLQSHINKPQPCSFLYHLTASPCPSPPSSTQTHQSPAHHKLMVSIAQYPARATVAAISAHRRIKSRPQKPNPATQFPFPPNSHHCSAIQINPNRVVPRPAPLSGLTPPDATASSTRAWPSHSPPRGRNHRFIICSSPPA
ncbi:hypothetical protein M0R45_030612 [Rubus argutus]|uniref:Uncharacterized protein n=1 Tax=Rubus argutus TaxID=59490 RepID=A0AAW1WBM1_RUBAR